jgi:hypothetical protein
MIQRKGTCCYLAHFGSLFVCFLLCDPSRWENVFALWEANADGKLKPIYNQEIKVRAFKAASQYYSRLLAPKLHMHGQ